MGGVLVRRVLEAEAEALELLAQTAEVPVPVELEQRLIAFGVTQRQPARTQVVLDIFAVAVAVVVLRQLVLADLAAEATGRLFLLLLETQIPAAEAEAQSQPRRPTVAREL